jgi:hypothetical protein
MCCFVVSWDVLHAIVSIESHGRQKDTTFVVAMLYLEISVVLVIYKYQVLCYILEDYGVAFYSTLCIFSIALSLFACDLADD